MRRVSCILPHIWPRQVRSKSWLPDPTEPFKLAAAAAQQTKEFLDAVTPPPLKLAAEQTKDFIDTVTPPPLKQAARESQQLFETVEKANRKVFEHVVDSQQEFFRRAAGTSQEQPEKTDKQPEKTDASHTPDGHVQHPTDIGTTVHSHFWDPTAADSPFVSSRRAYLRAHHHHTSRELVPDEDVEEYVDFLLANNILRNTPLPVRALVQPRQLYLRVVRLVLGVILRFCDMAEGEVLGKRMVLLKTPSDIRFRSSSGAKPLDQRVIKKLAQRVMSDHLGVSVFRKMGIPESFIVSMYEDIFALTIRIVMDVALTFQFRCLGHSVKISIDADDMLHTAPGWDVALDHGAFGRFDDENKREWAKTLVDELLMDDSCHITELPLSVQKEMYLHCVVIVAHLGETALNHCRCHVAGISLRPALDLSSSSLSSIMSIDTPF